MKPRPLPNSLSRQLQAARLRERGLSIKRIAQLMDLPPLKVQSLLASHRNRLIKLDQLKTRKALLTQLKHAITLRNIRSLTLSLALLRHQLP